MLIDTQKIQALLDNQQIPINQLAEASGIAPQVLGRYRNRSAHFDNMTLENVKRLQHAVQVIAATPKADLTLKGIRKTVRTFNDWTGQARIYFNPDNMTVWTEVYAGSNPEWTQYDNPRICELLSKGSPRMDTQWNQTTMRELKTLAFEVMRDEQAANGN